MTAPHEKNFWTRGSSLYGRYNDLYNDHVLSVSQMTTDMFRLSLSNWICKNINSTGTTRGAGTVDLSRPHKFVPFLVFVVWNFFYVISYDNVWFVFTSISCVIIYLFIYLRMLVSNTISIIHDIPAVYQLHDNWQCVGVTAYSSGVREFIRGFTGVRVAESLVFWLLLCHFVFFSFQIRLHFGSPSIYRFRLLLWYFLIFM